MVAKRVRDMSAASALTGTEKMYADDGSSDVYATPVQMRDYVTQNRILNLVDDFNGDVDQWTAYALTQTVPLRLYIPPGTYDFKTGHASRALMPGGGPSCVIDAYGVTAKIATLWSPSSTNAIPARVGSGGSSLPLARFNDVNPGSFTVTLADPATYATGFTAGRWVLLMGYDMQFFGYPQNNQWNEYKKITSVNTGTGLITFDSPIKYGYKVTWPQNTPGSQFVDDCGGPGTIVQMPTGWDTEGIIRGMTVTNSAGADVWYGSCRRMTMEDMTFPGHSPSPSNCQEIIHRRCTLSGNLVEVDKNVETCVYESCRISANHTVQSSSVGDLVVRDCIIDNMATPLRATFDNSTIGELTLGATAYGCTTTVVARNCRIADVQAATHFVNYGDFTSYANGVLRWDRSLAGSSGAGYFMIPGSSCFFTSGTSGTPIGGEFKVLDVTQTAGDFYIETTLPDPLTECLPTDADLVTAFGTSGKRIHGQTCPSVSFYNCDGDGQVRMLSRAPKGKPLWSYYYSGMIGGETSYVTAPLWGKLIKIVVKVHRAYTGALGNLDLQLFKGFSGAINFIHPDLTITTTLAPKVDLKIAGTRYIDFEEGTIVTNTADFNFNRIAFARPAVTVVGPSLSASISAESPDLWPIAELEMWTDQGVQTGDTRVIF